MDTFPDITVSALLGQACGDAFGAPFEYHNSAPTLSILSMREGRYLDSQDDVGAAIKRSRLPGLYTDDTQQALAMLWTWRQLVLKGHDPCDPKLFSSVLMKILDRMSKSRVGPFGVHRGTGQNFRSAIQHGTPVDTAGMGAAMRIGPVATLWPEDRPWELVPWALRVSEVTTRNELSKTAAAFFAAHVWKAVQGWDKPPMITEMFPNLEDNTTWSMMSRALDVLRWKGEEALLDFGVQTGLANKKLNCAANGFALTGIPWVIRCATGATNFSNALTGVCSSGGDTDTVGAMAGCLYAASRGLRPHDKLLANGFPAWMLENLIGFGDEHDHLRHPEKWHPVGTEEALTRMDKEYRAELKRKEAEKTDTCDMPF